LDAAWPERRQETVTTGFSTSTKEFEAVPVAVIVAPPALPSHTPFTLLKILFPAIVIVTSEAAAMSTPVRRMCHRPGRAAYRA
jgi:hypothetical protein